VFNAVGQQMITQHFDLHEGMNHLSLDIHSLAAGVYFVKVFDGEKNYCKKIFGFVKRQFRYIFTQLVGEE
jgi:hypothetical protein